MDTNPSESQPAPPESQDVPTPPAGPAMSEVIIMDDHIYLPVDAKGDVIPDWAVTAIPTTKVLRGKRLWMPDDLALELTKDRRRVEILSTPPKAEPPITPKADS
jgi:hypothetical protein